MPEKPTDEQLSHIERREHGRVRVTVPVHLASEVEALGYSRDISAGGILVTISDVLPNGASVDVSFPLPGTGQFVEVVGVVRWSRSIERGSTTVYEHGIEFETIPEAHRRDIANFVERSHGGGPHE